MGFWILAEEIAMTKTNILTQKDTANFLEVSRQYFNLPGLFRSLLIAGSIGAAMGGEAIANAEREPAPSTENRSGSASPSDVAGFGRHCAQPPIESMP